MRLNSILVVVLGIATVAAAACGGGSAEKNVFDAGITPGPGPDPQKVFGQDGGGYVDLGNGFGDGAAAAPDAGTASQDATSGGQVLTGVHIVPADAKLDVAGGFPATLPFKVMGSLDGSTEVDVTSRFVFYVPDNYLVGGFPANGGPTFTTRMPSSPDDPPQQGGTLTVQAQAENPGGALVTSATTLTVRLQALALPDPTGAVVPAPAATFFGALPGEADRDAGADASAADSGAALLDAKRAPVVFYPNDNTMLPPNLKLLEVHWQPGSMANTLYRVAFTSPASEIVYYVRCNSLGHAIVNGDCGLLLDQSGYGYLSQSNAGQGNVLLTVSGTDDTGTSYGVSAPVHLQFSQESVNGGVYYWDVSDTRIMRFDFGGTSTKPDVFIQPGDYGTGGTCVGCHTLSSDGTKLAASMGGQNVGNIVYVADLAKVTTPPAPARTDPAYLTLDEPSNNRIQFASFSPSGDRFVSVYADNMSAPALNTLWMHDGTTGNRISGAEKVLSFEPDHPSWSPDGTMIAMTHVGIHDTSQRERNGGIDVATFAGSTLGDPVVVIPSLQPGKNDYNPSFVPDSSFFFFSQSTCPVGQENNDNCDSDVAGNLNATTWAALPKASATPVHLDNAGKPGLGDNGLVPIDTFPRATPFETKQGSGKLFWFTVASQRTAGLRYRASGSTQQLLWMFAVDPAKVLAGEDGSYPGFFLPFQDMTTSNHIAEWTKKIVSATEAPPPPSPPPPPPPPAPPPATTVYIPR